MDEETEIWGGEPTNDIDLDNIDWGMVQSKIELRPSIELKDLFDKYQLTVNSVNVNVDIDKLIMLGIIKPEVNQ